MTPESLRTKVAVVRDRVATLGQLPLDDFTTFSQDPRNLDAALHRLQVGIQALIDIASYAVSKLALKSPSTSRDLFEILEEAGHLPAGSTARFGPLVGFRNRVVHLYDRLDPKIVFRIAAEDRNDLLDLLALLLEAIQSQPD